MTHYKTTLVHLGTVSPITGLNCDLSFNKFVYPGVEGGKLEANIMEFCFYFYSKFNGSQAGAIDSGAKTLFRERKRGAKAFFQKK